MRRTILAVSLVVLSLAAFVTGCGQSTPSSNPPAQHSEHGGGESKIAANLAKLSAEDRAAAEKQHHCPVSSEPLGSMGVPMKVEVQGRQVWLCCDGCEEQLKANPDKFLAKLK